MGLNVFMLFVGFALGSLVFSLFLRLGISTALVVFGTVGLLWNVPATCTSTRGIV